MNQATLRALVSATWILGLGMLASGCAATGWVGSWSKVGAPEQSWSLASEVQVGQTRLVFLRVDYPDEPQPHFVSLPLPTTHPVAFEAETEWRTCGTPFLGRAFEPRQPAEHYLHNRELQLYLLDLHSPPGWISYTASGTFLLPAVALDLASFPLQATAILVLLGLL